MQPALPKAGGRQGGFRLWGRKEARPAPPLPLSTAPSFGVILPEPQGSGAGPAGAWESSDREAALGRRERELARREAEVARREAAAASGAGGKVGGCWWCV